jgi:hypothetical protein
MCICCAILPCCNSVGTEWHSGFANFLVPAAAFSAERRHILVSDPSVRTGRARPEGRAFDLLVTVELGLVTRFKVCSHSTVQLAGRSMFGRSIAEAPNTHWMGSLFDQLPAV